MHDSYWQKQTPDTPLFPDLLWSRPENRAQSGKLLVIGGNASGFTAAAQAYSYAETAGIGTVRVLLPSSLQKSIGTIFEAGEFAPSTLNGSFGKPALAELVDLALWADGVLLAGDLGRNSETAILLEQFLDIYDGQVTATKDAADILGQLPYSILQRPKTLLVLSSGQLQRLATNAHFGRSFTSTMSLLQLLETLHEFTKRYTLSLVTKQSNILIVAVDGKLSTTTLNPDQSVWRLRFASLASTWWLQNPTKPFEALTTACTQ